jgi:hemin uptake protein HemP
MINNDLLDTPTSPPLGSNSESATPVAITAPVQRRSTRTTRPTGPLFASRSVRYFMMTEPEPNAPSSSPAHPVMPREINSADLMRGDREIVIRHGTELYRLNVTRSGKLILRK